MSLLAVAKGTSVMTETIFENRFSHVGELQRMGANIKIDSRSAVIEGVETLTGGKGARNRPARRCGAHFIRIGGEGRNGNQ